MLPLFGAVMTRFLQAMILSVAIVSARPAVAGLSAGPDAYLCYKAAIAKGQQKVAKDLTALVDDALGDARTVDVKEIVALCNPVSRDGSAVSLPDVHLESFAIKLHKGEVRFVKVDRMTVDAFGSRALTLTAPASLLDVTPLALGSVQPAPFAADPTSDPGVNRFACYKAKLAKGAPRFVPPPAPTLTDAFYTGGQQLLVTKVTKVCEPADVDGATAGAETRPSALVCYALKLPKHTAKFVKTTVATNDARVAPQILVASAPAELCLPAAQPTPTATVSPTPSPSGTPVPKRVFVTSTATQGAFNGTSGADSMCASLASAASLSGTFKAWLSVTGDGPSTRFTQASVPYALVDGTIVANDWSDLTDASLAHAIDIDETGAAVSAADVWTSTTTGGNPATPDCNGFTSASGGQTAICGNTGLKTGGWTNNSIPSCNLSLRLYCFEQ
ncbi:MAG TPA: hypothetical protein VGK30_16770 [Candidatus Binatia bacterium]